jgi:hypothetical protein
MQEQWVHKFNDKSIQDMLRDSIAKWQIKSKKLKWEASNIN